MGKLRSVLNGLVSGVGAAAFASLLLTSLPARSAEVPTNGPSFATSTQTLLPSASRAAATVTGDWVKLAVRNLPITLGSIGFTQAMTAFLDCTASGATTIDVYIQGQTSAAGNAINLGHFTQLGAAATGNQALNISGPLPFAIRAYAVVTGAVKTNTLSVVAVVGG
jgi:hypothetical protein